MTTTSVSVPQSHEESHSSLSARWPGIAALALSAVLTGGNIYLYSKANRLEGEISQLRSAFKSELVALQTDARSLNSENAKAIAAVRQQVEETDARSAQAATQATNVAKRYSAELSKKIELTQQAATTNHQELATQLGEIKTVAHETSSKLSGVATDVTSVRGEVQNTRGDLDKTIADLRSVRGDMGVQSGLIATNAKELAALRALGERDYFEFQLTKSKTPQRLGDVAVQLKKYDVKRNRYTLELIADDKRVEKKDRTINEPIQFYTGKARLPYELVVNEVRQDRVIGYLSAPKMKAIR